jgi:hypothetical protein
VLLIATVLAPLLMLLATSVERRLGPAAGGWTTALPLGFAVTLAAMALTTGPAAAGTIAASATGHVPAQVIFGLLFGAALTRWGLLAGGAAGTLGYLAASVALDRLPQHVAVFLALTALAAGTRLARSEHPRASRPRKPSATVFVCLSAAAGVLGATLASRAAGPVAGGTAAAFPMMSATLAVAVTAQASRRDGADVLAGLVRNLPCFFAFALTAAICARHLGLWSFAIAAAAAVAVAALTCHHTNTPKRSVPQRSLPHSSNSGTQACSGSGSASGGSGRVASVSAVTAPERPRRTATRWPRRSNRSPEAANTPGPNPATLPSSKKTLPEPSDGSKPRTVACMSRS